MTKLAQFEVAASEYAKTRLLFSWLADDQSRAELYQELVEAKTVLPFQSRADAKRTESDPSVFNQMVYLVAHPEHVKEILASAKFSNDPYRKLGSGTFMLGLDGKSHADQEGFVRSILRVPVRPAASPSVTQMPGAPSEEMKLFITQVGVLSEFAWIAAALQPLKVRNFDLAELAEQVALRFTGFLFGFALSDHYLLEQTLRKAFRGLNYQIFGRHFVSEPLTLLDANGAMGQLLVRTAALIDMYQQPSGREQTDERDRIASELDELRLAEVTYRAQSGSQGSPVLTSFDPLLKRFAEKEGAPSGAERAVMAVGLMVGTVGNIQAAVSMIVDDYFRRAQTDTSWDVFGGSDETAQRSQKAKVMSVLARHPPAAFLPRLSLEDVDVELTSASIRIPKDQLVVLAMGAGVPAAADAVFAGGSLHECIGTHIALPLVLQTVKHVLGLRGLARTIDAETGDIAPLRKLWGFKCESFPLQYDREDTLIQQALHVVMRVKAPVAFHAEALKTVIKYGAPRIELKLKQSRHVHFAWFQFLENDAKLALMTVYDGAFDSYIQHFASQIGPLFDLLFEHLEDAPPRPTAKFPREFVDTIRRFNVAPVAGYFFSAYPRTTVSEISEKPAL